MHEKGCVSVPVNKFQENKQLIRSAIETRGYNQELDSYVDVLDGERVDAGLLLLGLYRYADPSSMRMKNTCRTIVNHLGVDGLIYRYNVSEKKDAFESEEGTFALCGFWNVQLLAEMGQTERAVDGFRDLLQCANDVGLYAEEIDAETREPLGNFPQAYTHVGLINAACALHGQEHGDQKSSESKHDQEGVRA
jgi:GH15 family glucan-1,4-alpha-glucosidase